eukprot:TRINITY_DN16819_c0_g1_i2.p1 TRINITY_DN16819_c0_g1~~TRINITY_DN16819_c0_g1_i2.p1  ORF type:complete len:1586 (+),score=479.60 TRINITY_DN16819_c0_g1_i2:116-4759(+)
MRDFTLPFKPEELLAQPSDGRLWAADLPAVDEMPTQELNKALDNLIGRLLSSHGKDLAEDASFSLLFAILQAWPRLDESLQPRVIDLLSDATRRLVAEVGRVRKAAKPAKAGSDQADAAGKELRNAAKVAAFFLRWASERLFRQAPAEALGGRGRGRGRGAGGKAGNAAQQAEQAAAAEEAKESQRALEKQRCSVLGELSGLMSRGVMPWLWLSDPAAWQQAAQAVSDGGFYALDCMEALKHRETKQAALRCIADPLLQEGQQHSNLLVATVSKLVHGLRGGEGGAAFAADCLLQAHATPLPRLFLIELTQHCNPQELTSQGAFQRSLASFLVAVAERLPHVVLANISVLLPLLDVDCYPLRQAIVEGIGKLLESEGKKLPSGARCVVPAPAAEGEAEEEEAPQEVVQMPGDTFSVADATKKDLLETLMTRTLDKSVWVRYRVLQTLTSLASNTRTAALPRDQWPRCLDLAIRRMQDTASMSRKAAMQLVRTLVEFHPYGPALKGSGDERAKAEKLLLEIEDRFKKLKAEELAELEGENDEEGEQKEQTEEHPEKRRRLKAKTETDVSIVKEVDNDLNASGAMDAEGEDGASARHEAREKKREALRRMQDCYASRVRFVELLDNAESRLRGLLASKTSTDVTEAISVVVELRLRGVPAAARAFHQVLGLVWSRHLPIRDAAVDAFHRMHLDDRDSTSAVNAILEIYRDGCSSGSWTYTHLASVQELIQQAADRELVSPADVMPGLLAALAHSPACSPALRAITAFSASASGNASLVAALPKLKELFGPGGASVGATAEERLERVRLLGQLLSRLQSSSKTALSDDAAAHMLALSQYMTYTVVEHFVRGQVPPQWFGAAQVAMDLSFDVASVGKKSVDASHRFPDKVWEKILNKMLCSLLGGRQSSSAPIADDVESIVPAAEKGGEGSDLGADQVRQLSPPQLGCVAFVAGHLALKMLIFLEGMQTSLKKHRMAQEEAQMAEQREKNKEKKKKAAGKKGKASKAEEEEDDDDKQGEASMGGVGQEEREAEAFAEIAEQGLLYTANRLLDRVKPLLFACLLNKDLRSNALIRRLGAIGLCKFMTVSKRFCQENLQLLFSVLFPKGGKGAVAATAGEAAEDALSAGGLLEDLTLRQSLLVAVGDLLFRHPNVVEPWTGRLYATLSGPKSADLDKDNSAADLRLTALLVLTHLVLNDMMKARPVLLIRALWLTACPHEPTARVARILFQELSKRSTNVVYNLLPEIIARLPEHEAEAGVKGGANGRVQFIMQFVEKEKHIEGLIEKFTLRLEQSANTAGGHAPSATQPMATQGDAENHDMMDMEADAPAPGKAQDTVACLAHALGAMNYTDRCIMRLHDVIVVRKALNISLSYYPVVRECLLGVVEKARKPRPGKEKASDAAPPAEAEAANASGGDANGGGDKKGSAAAAAALDAIEQTINGLAQGKDDSEDKPAATEEIPAVAVRQPLQGINKSRAAPAKRKGAPEEGDAEPGFEDDKPSSGGRGRGRGKGRGKGRGAVEDKENLVKGALVASKPTGGKRRKAAVDDDDE